MNDSVKVELVKVEPLQLKANALCKWFSDEKGFGFLVCDGVGVDVFVHKQQLQKSGIDSIKEGDKLSCIINKGLKGMYATTLERIKD